jgi:hypothetical protein
MSSSIDNASWAVGLELSDTHAAILLDTLGAGEFETKDGIRCLVHPKLEAAADAREAAAEAEQLVALAHETLLLTKQRPITARLSGQIYRQYEDGRRGVTVLVDPGVFELRIMPVRLTYSGQPEEPTKRLVAERVAALKARCSQFADAMRRFGEASDDGKVLREVLDIIRFAKGLRKTKSLKTDDALAERIEALFGVEKQSFLRFKDTADNRWVHPRSKLSRGTEVNIEEGQAVIREMLVAWLDQEEPA